MVRSRNIVCIILLPQPFSAKCLLSFLLHFLLAYNKQHNQLSAVFLFLILCIGLISGRTFLFLCLVSIAIYFKWKYVPALVLFALLCLGLAFYYPQNPYVAHALEPLINVLNHQGLTSSSTETLMQRHLFMPEWKQILWGDGWYITPEGKYYERTDSGFYANYYMVVLAIYYYVFFLPLILCVKWH